ncbi:MAG: sugar ABC transporter permease [Actinobacteria bacterium]|nr:sugar ABC transporter permease [Actinomycetota bacterium]
MSEIVYNSFLEKNNKNHKFVMNESKYLPASLLLPAVILILFVVAIPMIYSLYLSFTNFTLIKSTGYKFIGINNYITLFRDPIFWRSFANTLIYITIAVNVEFLLGLVIANMMSHVIRGQGILRTIMMMPMMFAPILVGFQFKWVFNDQVGLINNILYSITGHPVIIPWLIQKPLGFIAIIIAEIWMSTPFMVIIFLAGIMSIPQELFEAADIDGASEWHKFCYITIPSISPFIYIAMAIRSLDIAKAYDLVSIITGGGPAHRTELIWTYVYRLAFTSQKFALGSSMSFITVLLSFAFTFYLFRNLLKARKI